jgi:GalNAc-alpha-(1->4)-GalNAc-alpha-(1->3)-diNAcBac-PP-undecaprenol alpha-1,4-N-acetyl-D-galactosaminyltransferase
MSKKEIFIYIPNLNIGGAETFVIHLINHLSPDIHVHLLLDEEKGRIGAIKRQNFSMTPLPSGIISKIRKLNKLLKSKQQATLFSLLAKTNIFCCIYKLLFNRHLYLICSERTSPEYYKFFSKEKKIYILYLKLLPLLYKYSASVLHVQTKENIQQWITLGAPKHKIKQIYNIVNAPSEIKLKEKTKKTLTILSVGRTVKVKNYDMIITTAKLLDDAELNYTWNILGGGELLETLKEKTKQQGLKNLHFLGSITNPEHYYKHCDILCLTSYIEGFPNVILEALSYGIPVISTNYPSGPKELISEGNNGFIIKINAHKDLKNQILDLNLDRKKLYEMSLNARQSIKQFSAKIIIPQFEKLLLQQ